MFLQVCMFMLFKCFKGRLFFILKLKLQLKFLTLAMSMVQPASATFLNVFISTPQIPLYYRKLFKTMKPLALKIGPNVVKPLTVPNAIMVLLNYYIAAALW